MKNNLSFKIRKVLYLAIFCISIFITLTGCHRTIPDNTTLKINFATGNSLTTLTYNTGTPITLPDNSYYTNGVLKPVWQYISDKLNLNLEDVSSQGQTASEMIEVNAATNFNSATIYGGNVAESFMSYGARGALVDLTKYKNELKDFFNYLEEYPAIASAITAYDGGIYYIPYIAEMDEFSRVFFGRTNWVEAILDGDVEILPETETLNVNYDGYWIGTNKRHNTNVIEQQNAAATNNVLTSSVAISILKSYINTTYPELSKPSHLYTGENAQYDIDELVALWRCMKLSPNTLSNFTVGEVVNDCEIVPYFFRTKNQREEIFKLINYFGGTRVYGTNTYTGKWFIDEENNLQYTFMQDELFAGIDYLKDIFSEGLINEDYDDQNNSANYRSLLYGSDLSKDKNNHSTVKQLGFMTFDFIPSTAASSSTGAVEAFLPPVTKLEGMHDNNYYHYIEIPRTVMTNGWAISANSNENEISKALKLFNYMFTDEGRFVSNFGIPGVTADFDNLYTTTKGNKVPTISEWLKTNASTYSSGDLATFASNYLGIRLAVGYVADIGFEIQYMTEEAQAGYDLYVNAGVLTLGYNKTSKLLELSPPCYSLTKQENSVLNTLSVGDFQMSMIYNYIRQGAKAVDSVDKIKQSYIDSDVATFIANYQAAYNRTKETK